MAWGLCTPLWGSEPSPALCSPRAARLHGGDRRTGDRQASGVTRRLTVVTVQAVAPGHGDPETTLSGWADR